MARTDKEAATPCWEQLGAGSEEGVEASGHQSADGGKDCTWAQGAVGSLLCTRSATSAHKCACFITAEKGGVARAKVVGEKETECTTDSRCKSQRRLDT